MTTNTPTAASSLRIRTLSQAERDAHSVTQAALAAEKLLKLRLDACQNAEKVIRANQRAAR
jgi:hypothetical protein